MMRKWVETGYIVERDRNKFGPKWNWKQEFDSNQDFNDTNRHCENWIVGHNQEWFDTHELLFESLIPRWRLIRIAIILIWFINSREKWFDSFKTEIIGGKLIRIKSLKNEILRSILTKFCSQLFEISFYASFKNNF